ncbi:LuxR family transcriptional regulator [Sphingomonas cannabina]|uniref:LuxR family transcriptional regulator n=1 Tax=Sphingomonas cannabina TaxID=2899123 RepID=UPI001F2F7C32|nr:LuxR family transcriptional regulator [Sphingomonas cannabina]UIJ44789.1 LuxR family transcriptional regulator [Sphingomonas cannabina]
MVLLPLVDDFVRAVGRVQSAPDLHTILAFFTAEMGFHFFALTHHVDMLKAGHTAIRVHDYPEEWAEFFDRSALGPTDPVHRASHVTSVGFAWSELPTLITMTAGDRRVLELAGRHGIGEGYTVPANVPGESNGSVSFAMRAGTPLPRCMRPAAQLIGAFAFEAARKLWRVRTPRTGLPTLTDRQRDCLIWVARGKSDWEISRILGVTEGTVVRHVKQARERYGVQKRTSLLMQTLLDGTISLADAAQWRYSHFWE